MNIGYLMYGIPLGNLLRLLREKGVSPGPKYLIRVLLLLQGSVWASFFAYRDRRRRAARGIRTPAPPDPVIIVGHWRTGSTFLHQLLNLDDRLAAPTLFQCCCPDSFLSSRRYIEPVLKRFANRRRPMDNVRLGFDEPHEDENALLRMTGLSPLTGLIFPRSDRYFLAGDETFLPPEPERGKWVEALREFLGRIHLQTGRRLVLKNPFHSLRIPLLRELFPEAAFIHLTRDPLQVIPSTVHMWTIVGRDNTLRSEWKPPSYEEVIAVYNKMEATLRKELPALPEGRKARIRFEDLEQDPPASVKALYQELNLEYTRSFEDRIKSFLQKTAGYQKNRYTLTKEQEIKIQNGVSP